MLTSSYYGNSRPHSPSCLDMGNNRQMRMRWKGSQSRTGRYWGQRGRGGTRTWRRWVSVNSVCSSSTLCWRVLKNNHNSTLMQDWICETMAIIIRVFHYTASLHLESANWVCSAQWWDKLDYKPSFYYVKIYFFSLRCPLSQDCSLQSARVRSLLYLNIYSSQDCILTVNTSFLWNVQLFMVCLCV